jgi:penicillin-binding protein 2
MCARIAGGAAAPNPTVIASGIKVPDAEITPIGAFRPGVLEAVRGGMFAVTSEPGGTAFSYLKGGSVDPNNELPAPYTGAHMAGKSGTAQVRVIHASERNSRGEAIKNDKLPWKLRDHALFVAYAPADKPRYAVAVVLEHGVSGSGLAAPIARDLLAHALKYDTGAKKPFVPQSRDLAAADAKAKPT